VLIASKKTQILAKVADLEPVVGTMEPPWKTLWRHVLRAVTCGDHAIWQSSGAKKQARDESDHASEKACE
jgi:hypothetical protein